MSPLVVLGLDLLHFAIYAEAAVIVVLILLVVRLCVVGDWFLSQRDRARRECDEARATLNAIQRMGEIRAETLARMRGFS